MRKTWALAVLAVAACFAGPASAAPVLVEVRNAAARVVVIPERRQDVKVEFAAINRALPLIVRTDRGRVVVDGRLRRRVGACGSELGKVTVRVRGLGEVPYDRLPQIVIRTPMDARVEASGAVFGAIARSGRLELSNAGCGVWTVANVRGAFKLNQAGSGDTRAGGVGELIVHVAGSGDVRVRDVAGGATLDIAGAGDVQADSISGPLRVSIAGSGDVRIGRGHATEMVVDLAGSGGVRFGGVADSMSATVAGSGDVEVARVVGPVKKSIIGSGGVIIGR